MDLCFALLFRWWCTQHATIDRLAVIVDFAVVVEFVDRFLQTAVIA